MKHAFKFFTADLQPDQVIFHMPLIKDGDLHVDILGEYAEALNDAFNLLLKPEKATNGDTVVKINTIGTSGRSAAYLLLSSLMNFDAETNTQANAA